MGGFSDHLSALLGIVVPHVDGVRLINLQADRRDCVRNLRIAWTLGGVMWCHDEIMCSGFEKQSSWTAGGGSGVPSQDSLHQTLILCRSRGGIYIQFCGS